MSHTIAAALVLLLAFSLASSERQHTPVELYQALLAERERLPDDLAEAKSAEERRKALAGNASLPQRFLDLAEQHPKHPVAPKALLDSITLVNRTAFTPADTNAPGNKALAILQRDHIRSSSLGRVCQLLTCAFHGRPEEFLRAVLKTSPHKDVQGVACLSLAQFLANRLDRLEMLDQQEDSSEDQRYHRLFGKDFVEKLRKQDRAKVAAEAEALFARAAEKFADVPIPETYYGDLGTVGRKAKVELFQIRQLAVGKVAPDIVGADQDGKKFALNDYRGKVVLLDFWYHL